MGDASQDESRHALPRMRTDHDQIHPQLLRLMQNHGEWSA